MTSQTLTFSELMLRLRTGESEALQRVLDDYGEAIRREVRFTLLDARLRRFVGESDVYQSVVMRFFSGMRDGDYRIDSAEDLVRLLKGIARTRIAELVRFWHAQRRDIGRTNDLLQSVEACAREPRCEEKLAQAEMVEAVVQILPARDRQILDWQEEGLKWREIAERLGVVSGEAVRKQHERSLARVAEQVGFDR